MDIVKLVSIAIFGLVTAMLVKKFNSDCAFYISVILSISITVFSIGILIPVFDYVRQLEESAVYGSFVGILFKSAGICLLCGTASELCRDAGEGSMASRIEMAGKCTLMTFSLPLIKTVFEYAKTFIT